MSAIPAPDLDRTFLWPILSRINILIVMDGTVGAQHYASFGAGGPDDEYFGLSEVIRVLRGPKTIFSHFSVTKAHRDQDVRGAADIENFRFDKHDLSVYDEIWLFGVAPEGGTLAIMSDDELFAITTFMDSGGGVFATGDHENLGVVLNGSIPRVRSMRKWFWPNPGPRGEPPAPPSVGSDRIETTQPGHGDPLSGQVLFDDQSDDIPQVIYPRLYAQYASVFSHWRYPHPLLCGPHGVINQFPDHMHEGEVIAPTDLSATFSFNNKQFVEYPQTGNQQTAPEVVAWGKVVPETNYVTPGEPHTGDPNDVATARMFGIVGAYDGHREKIGRVCVDSTWHHFFDINLIGDPAAPWPKNEGFNATPDGQAILINIERYYQNIATWLARPETQKKHFVAAAWFVTTSQPLNMLIRADEPYSLRDVIKLGNLGIESLRRFAPPCALLTWLWPIIVEGPGPIVPPDPWANVNVGDPVMVNPQLWLSAAIGCCAVALAQERRKIHSLESNEAIRIVTETVRRGVATSQRLLGKEFTLYADHLKRLAKQLGAA